MVGEGVYVVLENHSSSEKTKDAELAGQIVSIQVLEQMHLKENEAKIESYLKEAKDREIVLVRTVEELRRTLSQTQEEAVVKEDMYRKDIEDLQKQYQTSRRQCEELISQIPDSIRPLLRQFEAMQETTARRAETWAAVERSLNLRLQEAEAKATASDEKEIYARERLTQTLARLNVMETQLSSSRNEQTQLKRCLEKERQEAAANRLNCVSLKRELEAKRVLINQIDDKFHKLEKELHDAQELKQQPAIIPSAPSGNLIKETTPHENGSACSSIVKLDSLEVCTEATVLREELESLKRKHFIALELIGERDEELEVLRDDIVEMKNLYAKQVTVLVDKIRAMASARATPETNMF